MTEQKELFVPDENPNLSEAARDRLSNQLIKLGDMMGDGLHHEEPWIAREYRQTLKALYPDIFKRQRAERAAMINRNMAALLAEKKCPCGGTLKQTRAGTRACACTACGRKFKAIAARKNRKGLPD